MTVAITGLFVGGTLLGIMFGSSLPKEIRTRMILIIQILSDNQ